MFYTSYFIILVQFSFVKRKKQQTVRSRSSPGCLLFMIWKENNGRNSFVCSRAALPITGKWGSCCTIRLPCDMANARLGLSCGKRKQRPLAVPCIRFGPWAGLALHESFVLRYGECLFGLSCGKQKQRPLAVPCIRFGPWAGLASCRPLRQKFLPVSAAGSGRNFSPSRRPVPRRGR